MQETKTYTFEEAYEATRDYFGGDALAARVWVSKYAMKDSSGLIYEQTPTDMHWRLANEVARIEQKYPNSMGKDELFGLFDHFRYIIPAGNAMTGIGNPYPATLLSSCFAIGIEGNADSYGAILRLDEEQVQIMKRCGGVGNDLSQIRPKGTPVHNSALSSTGLVPFMERFSNSTHEVAQDGRRGTLMLSVSVKHPDTADFIDAKLEEGKATGANVCVRVTDQFMKAATENRYFTQQFPIDSDTPQVKKEISARKLWEKIVHNAWKSADPGVLFWDTILRESIPDCYADLGFRTTSVIPCGEMPLCPYDSSLLLTLNLYSYVVNPFTQEAHFDFDKFSRHAQWAQRIMDDIIDLELEKIDAILDKIEHDPQSDEVKHAEHRLWEKIKEKTSLGRRTGVGITAEGDMLAALGLRYGTTEATEMAVKVQQTLALNAYRASVTLAQERGAFAIYDAQREENNPFIGRLRKADPQLYADMARCGRRNIACLTIAPTGTISLMTQTSRGIEPVFVPVYKWRRKVSANDTDARVDYVDEMGDAFEETIVYHQKFVAWMKTKNYEPKKKYSQEELDNLVSRSPYYNATANDVDGLMKVRMLGAVQQWVDQSIAATVNLPNSADETMVNKLYVEAWRNGCKSCTIYRDGSRSEVTMAVAKSDKKNPNDDMAKDLRKATEVRKPVFQQPPVLETRPKELDCDVVRFQNNKEKWVAFVGLVDGRPYEIFTGLQDDEEGIVLPKTVTKGKIIKQTNPDGSHRYDFQFKNRRGYKTTVEGLSEKFNPEYWNYAKLISGVLRYRMPISHVIKLVGSLQLKSEHINTWKVGVERALKKYINDGTKGKGQICPVCGQETLVYQEGGMICTHCGASLCG